MRYPVGKHHYITDINRKSINKRFYIPLLIQQDQQDQQEQQEQPPPPQQQQQQRHMSEMAKRVKRKPSSPHTSRNNPKRVKRENDIFDVVGYGGKRKKIDFNLISPVAQAVDQAKALLAMKRRKCRKGACKQKGKSIKGGRPRRKVKKAKKKTWRRKR